MTITSSIDNELGFDQIAGVVSSCDGNLSCRLDFTPPHISQIQLVSVVQCLNTIATAKDIDTVVVDTSRVSATAAGSLACCLRICPCQCIYFFFLGKLGQRSSTSFKNNKSYQILKIYNQILPSAVPVSSMYTSLK